jgi:hypothetical protein
MGSKGDAANPGEPAGQPKPTFVLWETNHMKKRHLSGVQLFQMSSQEPKETEEGHGN